MDQVWKNLGDASWWFTGVFFVMFGILLTKFVFSWLPFLWAKVSRFLPKLSRAIYRWNEKRVLTKIKNSRQKDMKIVWLIGRFWALVMLSTLYVGFVLVYFALSVNMSIQSGIEIEHVLTVLPVYVFWLFIAWHKKTLFRIMKANDHWKRITNKSSGRKETRR